MVEVGQGWEGSTYARKRSKIYTISVFRNIRRQIIFEIFGSNIFFSVCRYFKTDIFLRYTLYVQKDSKKQIKQERKTKIRKKKDGSRHIVQVCRGRSIQKWKKNIRYPYLFEQRYSRNLQRNNTEIGSKIILEVLISVTMLELKMMYYKK